MRTLAAITLIASVIWLGLNLAIFVVVACLSDGSDRWLFRGDDRSWHRIDVLFPGFHLGLDASAWLHKPIGSK